VNTVKDLRQVLSDEVRRLDAPAGLETRVLQLALRPSAARGSTRRPARGGWFRPLERKTRGAPRLMPLVAALLAVAIVLSMVAAARALHLINAIPGGRSPVGPRLVVRTVEFSCTLPTTGLDPTTALFVQVHLPGGLLGGKSYAPTHLTLPPALAQEYGGNPTIGRYDVQMGEWLPALPQWISPDGRSWAYATGHESGRNGSVHVVDAATGRDKQLWSGAGGATMLGYLPSGVYFEVADLVPAAPYPYGSIWVVDPTGSGTAHKVGPYPFPNLGVPGDPAFGTAGAFAVNAPLGRDADTVVRMDLGTGNLTTWFTSPIGPTQMKLLGLDAQGRPIIAINARQSRSPRVLLLTGPSSFVEIANGSDTAFKPDTAVGDSHGVWFSEPGSIWLYQPGSGLRAVFGVPVSLSPTWPSPNPSKFPNGIVPSPSPPTSGEPTGYELTVIGPCT
jgi:hypothetical protein